MDKPKPFLETAIDLAGFSTDARAYEATFTLLTNIVLDVQRFDVGAEWVSETKIQTLDDKLQMALLMAMGLGILMGPTPEAQQALQAAVARRAKQPKLDIIHAIVADERSRFWQRHEDEAPGSRSGAEVAGHIADAVNARLISAGMAEMAVNTIAKRINDLDDEEGVARRRRRGSTERTT